MIMPGMSTVRTAYGTYSDLGLSLDGHFLKEGGGRGQCMCFRAVKGVFRRPM